MYNKRNFLPLLALVIITFNADAIGQSLHTHADNMHDKKHSITLPKESGQSAFAAIAEIVAILEADPQTDWASVSIDALREHLLDMDRLTLSSVVHTEILNDQSIKFKISGEGPTIKAIQNMVSAHARVIRTLRDWNIQVMNQSDGVTLMIDTESSEQLVKVRALGFFGFMAIGAHHQLHHLQMATGKTH